MIRGASRRSTIASIIALAVSSAIAFAPQGAHSQRPASPRHVGVLLGAGLPGEDWTQAFRQGLLDAGYAEGRDVVIEWRSAKGDQGLLSQLAADLVQRKVEVIVVVGMPAAQVAKRTTSTIPIVLGIVADPIAAELVTSFARPSGNITGLSNFAEDLSAKRLQLLKEVMPRVARVGVLWNPGTSFHARVVEEMKAAAPSLSMELTFVPVRTPEQISAAFSTVRRAQVQAVYVIEDILFYTHRMTIFKLASDTRLPMIYQAKEVAREEGLFSYAPSYEDLMRRSAGYVDKILKGAKPGDLPIEQPTQFELVINLRTAKAHGITIPQSVLLRADEIVR